VKLTGWPPGSEADIRYQNEVGDCEFKWMREYGSAWRRTGCFGVSVYFVQNFSPFISNLNILQRDHLMLADPRALQYLLHQTGYRYPKSVDRAHFNELVVGKGLVTVQGWYFYCMTTNTRSSVEPRRRSTSPSAEGHNTRVQRTAITVIPSLVPQHGVQGSTFGRLRLNGCHLIIIRADRQEMGRHYCH